MCNKLPMVLLKMMKVSATNNKTDFKMCVKNIEEKQIVDATNVTIYNYELLYTIGLLCIKINLYYRIL